MSQELWAGLDVRNFEPADDQVFAAMSLCQGVLKSHHLQHMMQHQTSILKSTTRTGQRLFFYIDIAKSLHRSPVPYHTISYARACTPTHIKRMSLFSLALAVLLTSKASYTLSLGRPSAYH